MRGPLCRSKEGAAESWVGTRVAPGPSASTLCGIIRAPAVHQWATTLEFCGQRHRWGPFLSVAAYTTSSLTKISKWSYFSDNLKKPTPRQMVWWWCGKGGKGSGDTKKGLALYCVWSKMSSAVSHSTVYVPRKKNVRWNYKGPSL